MIKYLSIKHFKGFYSLQKIEFAVPDNHHEGSGLSVVVGPNNTGKTTILDSLLMRGDKRFKESERHLRGKPKIIIENTNGDKATFTTIENGSSIEVAGEHGINFEVIPSRRFWGHKFNGEWDFPTFIGQSFNSSTRTTGEFNLGPILNKILKDDSLRGKFNAYMRELVPHFTSWTIDTGDDNNDYVKYKTKKHYHQASMLGDGVISLFRIVAHLVHDESSTFIIDEPELSLHPSSQRRLSNVLSKLSQNKQIIVCTHSPYFVNWRDFLNNAKIIRLNKHLDDKCMVCKLDNSKDYASFISSSINDYQKPQLLDVAAKEILFTDRILFLEGQEDVGLIKKWFIENNKELNFDIFGYGTGGSDNMRLFLEIARDLSIEKVSALYDGNAGSFTSDKRNYNKYLLTKLNTDDIRDKENKCVERCPYGKNREGTFDQNGQIKTAQQGEFSKIMQNIIEYFEK